MTRASFRTVTPRLPKAGQRACEIKLNFRPGYWLIGYLYANACDDGFLIISFLSNIGPARIARLRNWWLGISTGFTRPRGGGWGMNILRKMWCKLSSWLWRAKGRFREGTVVSGWLFGVMRYTSAKALRAERRRKRHEMAAGEQRQIGDEIGDKQWE